LARRPPRGTKKVVLAVLRCAAAAPLRGAGPSRPRPSSPVRAARGAAP
jgi:hypothetical protein